MLRHPIAMAVAMGLLALCPLAPRAETTVSLSRQVATDIPMRMADLVPMLEDWIDAQSDHPRRAAPPRIRLVSPWQAQARQGVSGSFQRGRLRGLYDPDRQEILLIRPWASTTLQDVGVLLHELVHHRQAPHHWYCPAAQEEEAYRLQDRWLRGHGEIADINWIAGTLDAGCTPRDIHPD